MRGVARRCGLLIAAALAQAALLAAPAALIGRADARIAAFLALSVIAALAERAGGAAEEIESRGDGLYRRLAAAGGLGLLAMSWIGIAQRAADGPGSPGFSLHWAWPVSLALLGVGLRGWSAASLGPTFDAPPSPQQPRTAKGPYAFLAHPSEIGLLAFSLAAACLLESPWAVAAWALLVAPPSLARAALEDRIRHHAPTAHGVTP